MRKWVSGLLSTTQWHWTIKRNENLAIIEIGSLLFVVLKGWQYKCAIVVKVSSVTIIIAHILPSLATCELENPIGSWTQSKYSRIHLLIFRVNRQSFRNVWNHSCSFNTVVIAFSSFTNIFLSTEKLKRNSIMSPIHTHTNVVHLHFFIHQ